jgi:hypothetical protein
MEIAFIIYFIGGILINIFGKSAETFRIEFRKMWDQLSDLPEKESHLIQRFKIFAIVLIIRLLLAAFFPVVLVIHVIDHFRVIKRGNSFVPFDDETIQAKIKKEREEKKKAVIDNRSFLYFKNTFGGGIIRCPGCGYEEEINGSTHGFGDPVEFFDGYQCQICGKFHTVTICGNENIILYKCDCGGELSRDKPIFCPKCKARDVSYQWTYMT